MDALPESLPRRRLEKVLLHNCNLKWVGGKKWVENYLSIKTLLSAFEPDLSLASISL